MKHTLIAFAAACVLASFAHANLVVTSLYHYVYTPIAIPTSMSNYRDLEPTGINNSNQVVGVGYIPGFGGPEAFINSNGKTQMYMFPGPYADCVGYGINDAGTIIGGGVTDSGLHVFDASLTQSATDIDGNPHHDSWGKAITNTGYYVGSLNNQPALGSISGHWIISIGQIVGNDFYMAGVNDNLTMVGYGSAGGKIYDLGSGTVTQLSTVLGTTNNRASAINQAGVVAGTVGNEGFIYDHGTVTYFGTNIAWVNAINSLGNVVGALTNGHGFIYTAASHTVTDLNTLLPATLASTWTITTGSGINDKNSICGVATRPSKASDSGQGWGSTVYQGFTLIIEGAIVITK